MLDGTTLDRTMVRRHHTLLVFNLIREAERISRVELAKATGMSNTAVGNIIKDLIKRNLVKEVGFTSGSVGRKPTLLEVNPQGAIIIGLDLDIDKGSLGIVDLSGNVLKKNECKIDFFQPYELVFKDILRNIKELINNSSDKDVKKILGIGISMPGLISWPDGEIKAVPQFNWENVNLRAYLEEQLDLAVYMDNNVKATLLGEYFFGSVRDSRHAVCIHIGSGVGSAVIENGEILRGANNILGEIGHMIMEPSGLLCDCGRFGCLQTFICSNSLEKQLGKPIKEIISGAEKNDVGAKKLLDRADEYLAIAIANVICLYNPEAILLVGSMVEQRKDLWPKVGAIVHKYLWAPLKESYDIRVPELGGDVGIIGASSIVLSEQLKSPFQRSNELIDTTLTY